jgi:hypothetical protein
VAFAAIISTLGCGGNSASLTEEPVPNAGTVAPRERSNGGGAFSAYYAGTFTKKSCGFECTALTITGTGHASFLHKSTQSETLKTNCAIEGCTTTGIATLTSDQHPQNTINMGLWSEFESDLEWSADGGTGKFASVSGTGYWQTTYGAGTYTQSLSGTLSY